MSDDLVKFLRHDVNGYIASWYGEFGCDDSDRARADTDRAQAEKAADRIEQLERQVAVAENALSTISHLSSRSKFAKELGNCAKHALSEMEIETDTNK